MTEKCALCKSLAKQSCSMCNSVYYCSKEHQKLDWKNHKPNCAPFKVLTSSHLGRYLIAKRDINEGEIIMRKLPLITAPKVVSYPICLGCHKRLTGEFYKCSSCQWPMCGRDCQKLDTHKVECKIFTEKTYRPEISNAKQGVYALIAPLRSLILKNSDKKKYEILISLQSHHKESSNTPLYKLLRMNLPPLINRLGITTSEEEILQICSIFDTNAFEIRDTDGLINIRGLYPMVSLIAHDCTINTKHSFHGTNHEIHIIATRSIKKGDIITTTYTQTLWGTLSRRAHLKQVKNFDCTCKRCADCTEFGTYAGSTTCPTCEKGMMISGNALDVDSIWKCTDCTHTIPASDVIATNASIKKEILSIDRGDPGNFETFLDAYQSKLHPTNCHILEVKYALVQMYGNMNGFYLYEISYDLLLRKIALCNELIAVADILEPACSRFRGHLLLDLQAAMVEKWRRDQENNNNNNKECLLKSLKLLEEATRILETEPNMSEVLATSLSRLLKLIGSQ